MDVWIVNIKFCRQVLRRSKIIKNIPHRFGISAEHLEKDAAETKAPHSVVRQKPEKTAKLLADTLHNNCLFDGVEANQIQACVNLMWKMEIKKGQTHIKQGDHGDYFYVIESG